MIFQLSQVYFFPIENAKKMTFLTPSICHITTFLCVGKWYSEFLLEQVMGCFIQVLELFQREQANLQFNSLNYEFSFSHAE